MEPYRILIPSYKRSERQPTLELLSSAYTKEDIVISTQCMEDYEKYYKLYSDRATVIYKEGNCVGDNRNTLLDYACGKGIKRCVMLDDDITGFLCYNKVKIKDGKKAKELFEYCMKVAEYTKATLFGLYPVQNTFYMNTKVVRNILIGTCFGIMDTSLRFDRMFRIKENYELCLRVMQRGGLSIRFNGYAPIAQHKTAGGCMEDWKTKGNDKYAYLLTEMYPRLVKLSTKRAGEIRFIG